MLQPQQRQREPAAGSSSSILCLRGTAFPRSVTAAAGHLEVEKHCSAAAGAKRGKAVPQQQPPPSSVLGDTCSHRSGPQSNGKQLAPRSDCHGIPSQGTRRRGQDAGVHRCSKSSSVRRTHSSGGRCLCSEEGYKGLCCTCIAATVKMVTPSLALLFLGIIAAKNDAIIMERCKLAAILRDEGMEGFAGTRIEESLQDDNITDDIDCAKRVVQGKKGFKAW
ncbi:Hypothetical predicted protein [Podarcis lilfordi]|uniref:Lysozyme n=1 Tax=Podarcis lilfordi TaxID=74358 RepID=A0AA35PS26_9SAUR|nr:Hypothetical predicted protein [Podarcis lilfordi]